MTGPTLVVTSSSSMPVGAVHVGISEQMVNCRLNITGARRSALSAAPFVVLRFA